MRRRAALGQGTTGPWSVAPRALAAPLLAAVVLTVLVAATVQLLPVPGASAPKAGAAVTPLPTPSAYDGGRVPEATTTTGGTTGGGGRFHTNIVERGGCQPGSPQWWGSNYTGIAYAAGGGTWSVNASGGVFAEGTAGFYGSLPGITVCPNEPIVSIAATPDGGGYWLATKGGGVFAFGDAKTRTYGSMISHGYKFTTGIVAIVADRGTNGFWLVSALGQVYTFGGAGYYGGSPALFHTFGEKIVAMASTPTGGGYWLLANTGRVFVYGDASYGSYNPSTNGSRLGGTNFNWFSGIAAGPSGDGFWAVRYGGQTYAYGPSYLGNVNPGAAHIVGMAGTTNQGGYVLTDTTGHPYPAGDAAEVASPPNVTPPKTTTLSTPPPSGNASQQTGGGGNPVTIAQEPCAGAPVNCESGNEWETDTDVTVPGPGPHLDLTRTFNSQDQKTKGIFGYGWSSSYSMSVAVTPTKSTMVTEANGSTVTFYTNTTGVFVAPKGTLATLARNPTGGYTFRVRNTTTYVFNADGRLVAERDLNGLTTTLTYNTAGQLTTVTDWSGRTIQFTYNATGFVSTVTNPAGQVTSYGYYNGNLMSVVNPAEQNTSYTYDTHTIRSETSPTGGTTWTYYNTAGQVIKQTDPAGLTTTWAYTGNNAVLGTTTITGPTGSVTVEGFIGGQMSERTTAYGTPSAATWHYTYTPTTFGQTSVKNPNGNTTTTTYNATGDVTSTTDPLGHKTTTTYNSFNEPTVTVDPMGVTTTNTYDTHGNLIKRVVTANSSCTSNCTQTTTYKICETVTCNGYLFTWHGGELETTVDPAGHWTRYFYDTHGDVEYTVGYPIPGNTSVVEDAQDVYNVLGQKVCALAPPAYAQDIHCPAPGGSRVASTTTWTYNTAGQVATETNALTQTTSDSYNIPHGTTLCTATISGAAYCDITSNPVGSKTVTYYDQDGRVVGKVTGAGTSAASTTSTAYDVLPGHGSCATGVATATNCDVTTNGNGKATVSYYNAATEVIKTVAPGTMVTTATYDGTGNPITKTTAAGTTTNAYNKDNHLTSVTYSNTTSGFTKPTNVTYTYNADGLQTKMVDATGTTTSTYDGFERLKSTNDGTGKTTSYGYNADGEVTTLTYTDGKTVHRTYNGVGEMTSTTDLQGRKTTFAYSLTAPGVTGGSQMTTITPNGESETTTDNALGQQIKASLTPTAQAPTDPTAPTWHTTVESSTFKAVSCPSTTLCVAVGPTGTVATATHPTGSATTWSQAPQLKNEGTPVDFTGISCPSTTMCAAVGATTPTSETGEVITSTNPTGAVPTWRVDHVKGTNHRHALTAISCPTTTFCVAVGTTGHVVSSTNPAAGAGTWHAIKITGTESFAAVSCPTITLCVAVGETGKIYTSTNPTGAAATWTKTTITGASTFFSVSCPATTRCVVGGRTGKIYTSTNPTGGAATWKLTTITAGKVRAISCPTTTLCVAAVSTGNAFVTTSWHTGVATWAKTSGIDYGGWTGGISCPATTLCVVAGATADDKEIVTRRTGALVTPASLGVTDTYGTNDLLSGESETEGTASVTNDDYTYNANDQVTTVHDTGAGTPGATGTYAYDGAGDPTSVVNATTGKAVTQTFNSAGELQTAATSGGSTATLSYDALGDRTKESVSGESGESHEDYNQVGELTQTTTTTETAASFASYTYNGDGLRMKVLETETFQWFDTIEAGGFVIPSTKYEFTWDTEGSTPQLLSDGAHYFIYGPGGQVIEQENTTATGKDPLYLVHDALGSTVAVTNQHEGVSTYTYNAYGAPVGHTGPNTTPIGFAGGYTDPISGLLYLVHRYYDPKTGEFLSVDPDVATTHQPYDYAGDDPVNNTDPLGLCWPSFACGPEHAIGEAATTVYGTGNRTAHVIIGGAIIAGADLPITLGAAGATLNGDTPSEFIQTVLESPLGGVLEAANAYGVGMIATGLWSSEPGSSEPGSSSRKNSSPNPSSKSSSISLATFYEMLLFLSPPPNEC